MNPSAPNNAALDPVKLSLVQNRLDHITRQMGWVMTRTARSPIFSQSHDFSCFLTDPTGTLVSQADGIPIHTGGGGFAARAVLRDFAGNLNDGDVFVLNDPYTAGGNHLPDWVIARPIFHRGELAALACNRAHQADIGGGAAGTYNSRATEIFHEGIRLPVLKLIEAGETRADLWRLLLLNSRTPEALDGDLRAMIGSTRIGGERVAALIAELSDQEQGDTAYRHYFDGILNHADRRFRQCIARLPDGEYDVAEPVNHDCFEPTDAMIRIRLTVKGDAMTVDFTGTDDQVRGFKNSSQANTWSAVYMALSSYFEPDLPRNEGTFRAVEIIAPEGSVVNARAPAAMTMNTVFVAHEIVTAIWTALGQALPDLSCAGWSKAIHSISSGQAQGHDNPYVMYHWAGAPAGGAVEGRDGFNLIGHLIALGGLVLPNLETYEQLYPATFIRQEFRTDAAGPGRWRGGSGCDYEVELHTPAEHTFRGEGLYDVSGHGIQGGGDGRAGELTLADPEGKILQAPKYGVEQHGPVRLHGLSPGGGGYGDPKQRPAERVLRDVRDEIVSPQAALEIYGVVLDADGRRIDWQKTNQLRENDR